MAIQRSPVIGVSVGNNRISQLLPQPQTAVAATQTGAVTDSQQQALTIPAASTVRLNLAGISFYFAAMSSVSGVSARPVNAGQTRSFITYFLGQGLRLGTSGFQQIELVNLDPINANTLTVVVGGGIPNNSYDEFIDKRVIIVNNPSSNIFVEWGATTFVGFKARVGAWADSIAGGATQDIPGGYLGKSRKQVILANDDAGNILTVFDSGNNIMGSIQPSTSWTIEGSDDIKLHNPNVGAVVAHIGEVYYNQ